jgi:carbon monoxide dehydrogenase subunit G
VKGQGTLELTEEAPDQTLLRYTGDVQVGGMIASVGQRLIEGAAKLLINQGMKALAQRVEQG